jgi:hypothetical protein
MNEALTNEALILMGQIGGAFAKAIAQAYTVADSGNRQRLLAAFPELFAKYQNFIRVDKEQKS